MAGLTLSYLAGGVITPVAAGLILAGSFAGLGKHLGSLAFGQRLRKARVNPGTETWQGIAEKHRLANWQGRTLARVLVKLAGVCLEVATLAFCCLYPPTLLFTAGGLSLLALSSALQYLVFKRLDRHYALKLQENLSAIDLVPEAALCPSAHPTAIKLNRIQEGLDKRQLHLEQREEVLDVREQAICDTLMAVEKGVSSPTKALRGLGGSIKSMPTDSANEELVFDDLQRQKSLSAPLILIENKEKIDNIYQEEDSLQSYQY
ncbi:hypothetical protein [Legionella tunisiensis]|uniref:hypothetical protein n=1 Tax=Legionella tunisiensis TaxID=1034944 RepID=UPI0002F737AB|nr:hypothetical protein [Legionella tunisiensis]